jgi:hypothetical protein
MITQVRTARPSISLGGVDYYNQLAPYLLKFQYTDSSDGQKTDDCQFELADRDRKFINEWMPAPGATFDASILCERWFGPTAATLELPCGTFYIDSIEFDLPAHTVSVKANAIPNNTHGKVSNETRGWGDGTPGSGGGGITLRDIVNQIAAKNNLKPVYPDNLRNPKYDRVEQVEESAFQFIKRHANDAKLEMKIAKGQLIIFDPLTMDQAAPSFTLVYGDVSGVGDTTIFRMSGGRFRLQVTDLTASTVISNTDIADGETTSREFDANQLLQGTGVGAGESVAFPSTWKDNLNWNTDVQQGAGGGGAPSGQKSTRDDPTAGLVGVYSNDSGAADAALTKAQARTREKNRRQYESDIVMAIGNPLVAAGQTFILVGCGQFDGKWFIETAHHVVAPMYDTTLHIRRTLDGY